MKHLILASQSPRRQTLLSQLGYQFITLVADIDESVAPNESPKAYVLRLAIEKAQSIYSQLPKKEQMDALVLGADTCVVINGEILGKPRNETDCINTLLKLSNNKHQVLTSIAVVGKQLVVSKVISTDVYFKDLTVNEIRLYWKTGEPVDKAGSYAIQGIGGQFVTRINGSYSAVVGLPLYETAQLLASVELPTVIQSLNAKS